MYKVIIPENLIKKIYHCCNAIPNQEWCGDLFYTMDKTDILVKDIYPLSIDTVDNTKVDRQDRSTPADIVASLLIEHNCKKGYIHSHHKMSTSPSGRDIQQIKDGADIENIYLSLIVNNQHPEGWSAYVGVKQKILSPNWDDEYQHDGHYKVEIIKCNITTRPLQYDEFDAIEEQLVQMWEDYEQKKAAFKFNQIKLNPVKKEKKSNPVHYNYDLEEDFYNEKWDNEREIHLSTLTPVLKIAVVEFEKTYNVELIDVLSSESDGITACFSNETKDVEVTFDQHGNVVNTVNYKL